MRKTFEALWYGNIEPQQICKRNNPKVMDLLSLLSRNRTELKETLTDEQKEILQKWDDNEQEMTVIVEKEIFINGFRLGARFVLEALCDDNPLDEENTNNLLKNGRRKYSPISFLLILAYKTEFIQESCKR